MNTPILLNSVVFTLFFSVLCPDLPEKKLVTLPGTEAASEVESVVLVDKVTFRVDTRNITVAPTGMFIAGSFFSTIGYTNWTFIPMCDLGSGIWEISFADVPPGLYQYKFVNGNAPPGWEFNGSGGPCTNPLDNNNRWVTVTGGVQMEGPHCFNTCNMFCTGFSDPGVSDVTPPVITGAPPANTTISCGSPLPAALPLNANDGCDANATTTTGPPVDNTAGLTPCGTGQIIRTWSVTDCSGNMASVSQTITVTDNAPPTITGAVPPNVTVQCGNLPAPMALAATDACDPTVSTTGLPTDNTSGIGPCGTGQVVRTWTASDCSGNMTTTTQTISLTDNTAPVITGSVPANISVSCGNIPPPVALTASDNCDTGITSTGPPSDDLSGIGPCGTGQIIRIWTVTDCSGNSVSASQTIMVNDNTPPAITSAPPAPLTVQCGNPLPAGAALSASDDCDANISTTGLPSDDLSGIGPCGTGQVVRTWSVTDCSNNVTTVTQIITLADLAGPAIVDPVPANENVDCGNIPPALPLSAFDDCDPNVLTTGLPSDDLSGMGTCGSGTILRTWSVSDCSGNTTTASQLITVTDNTPPVINGPVPVNISVSCGNVPVAQALPAFDACDLAVNATGLPSDDLSGLSACGTGPIIRTWTVTDCAGNSTSENQVITVIDNQPPVLVVPINAAYNCNNIPAASAGDASASDNCTPTPTIVYQGETIVGTGCPYEIHRTWTATDCDGNSSSQTQVITVSDTQAPVFSNPPANVSVCIGNVPPMVPLTWTDNCDGTGSVSGSDVSDGMTNPETISRTWTYTDACGNVVTYTQLITVSESGQSNVGPDPTICEGGVVSLVATGAGGATSVLWTTAGDGVFEDEMAISTTYTPGQNDLANGSVLLTFTPGTAGGACNINPDDLTVTINPIPAANAGPDQTIDCDHATVTLEGSGFSPVGAVFFEWSGPGITVLNANEQNPEVASPGIYTLTVSQGNCEATSTVSVFQSATPPVANAGPDMMLTCTQATVTLDGSASSAGASIEYLWTGPGITPANESSLSPTVSESGIYELIVSNAANGCTATDMVEVQLDGDLPMADAGPDQMIKCNNYVELDGSNSSSGPGIIYQWFAPDGTLLGTTAMQHAATDGTYTLTVTDTSNGCSISSTAEVTMDTIHPIADAGPDRILGCGNNASVILGGNSSIGTDYAYAWAMGGFAAGSQPTLTATQPGVYYFAVSSFINGCVSHDTVVVFANTTLPIADAGPDQVLNCSASTVMLNGSGSSAGADIAYQWNGPGFNAAIQNPSVSVAGTYVLTVTNTSSACVATDTVVVTADADLPVSDAGPDMVLNCLLDQVTTDAGNSSQGPDFQYEWTDAGGVIIGNMLDISIGNPGVYTLTVTNLLTNCASSDGLMIGLDTLSPVADAGADVAFTCIQNAAQLGGAGTSAGSSFTYEWTGPGISTDPSLPVITVEDSGIYTLTVTNQNNGCMAADEAVVSQNPDVPTADAGSDQVIDCIVSSVTLQGSASLPLVTWQWSGPGINAGNAPQQNPVVSVPGVYTLVVTDIQTGCMSPDSTVNVAVGKILPNVSVQVTGDLVCQTASVLLDGSASAQGANISYQWFFENNPLPNAMMDTWMAVNAGTYVLGVLDIGSGCVSADTMEVVDNSVLPPVSITGPSMLNCTISLIELVETAAAGLPGMQFQWMTNGGHFTQPQLNQASVQLDAPGQYIVIVTDSSNGCMAADTLQVEGDFEKPVVLFDQLFQLGCGVPEVTLSANVSASTSGFAYAWTGPGFSSTLEIPTVSLSGTYSLTVTSLSNGCSETAQTEVLQSAGISGVELTVNPPLCPGDAGGQLQIDHVIGTNPPFQFSVNGSPFTQDTLFGNLLPGNYKLVIKDSEGCEYEDVFSIADAPLFFVDLGEDLLIRLGDSVQLTPNIPGPVIVYEWSDSGTLSCPDCPEPYARPLETTVYSLTVTNSSGCYATDEITVAIDKRFDIYVPLVFSPNGDGINDQFTLFSGNQVLKINQLQIFDRWGAQLFVTRDIVLNEPALGWDGTFNGKEMGAGTYVFWAEILLADGRREVVKGEVLLVK